MSASHYAQLEGSNFTDPKLLYLTLRVFFFFCPFLSEFSESVGVLLIRMVTMLQLSNTSFLKLPLS